ncbi:hypothetical protein SFRURICE_019304, partial [Spodoptera frugiperda]
LRATMRYLLLAVCIGLACAQSTIDPSVLEGIFGTPPTPKPVGPVTPALEDITVKPTEGTSVFTDKNGEACQCVPYYLCDANQVGVDVNNASVTGWGTLDIRFGEDNDIDRQCQESVEVCCTIPKDTSEQPKPKPKPKPEPNQAKGALNLNSASSPGWWLSWTSTTPHFMPKSLKNDIALLYLDSPLPISEYINVICMPEQDEVFDSHKNCVANGWGKSHFGFSPVSWVRLQTYKPETTICGSHKSCSVRESNPLPVARQPVAQPPHQPCSQVEKTSLQNRYAVILKKVELDMVPYSRCQSLLRRTRLGHNFKLHNSFVCAGGEAGKDTCQGDGGAPLGCPVGNNRYKLTGLVAWGIGCGQQDVPAVYTNVPLFAHWVDDKMAQWGLEATSYRYSE